MIKDLMRENCATVDMICNYPGLSQEDRDLYLSTLACIILEKVSPVARNVIFENFDSMSAQVAETLKAKHS